MRQPTNRLGRRLRTWSIVLLMSVVACEAALRMVEAIWPDVFRLDPPITLPDLTMWQPAHDQPATWMQLHPYRGWTVRPGSPAQVDWDVIPRMAPGVSREAIRSWLQERPANTLGFSSTVQDYRSLQDDQLVVGIFGGSVAEHVALVGEVVIREVLAASLALAPETIHVISFALPGYKQPQQVLALVEALLLRIPLDAVVNIDGVNEASFLASGDNARHHPLYPPIYQIAPALAVLGGSLKADDLERFASIRRDRRHAARLEHFAAHSIIRFSAIARTWCRILARRLGERAAIAQQQLQQSLAGRHPARDIMASLDDPCMDSNDACQHVMADLWSTSSMLMATLARQAGAAYLHVLQPNQYVQGSKPMLSPEERRYAYLPEDPPSLAIKRGYPLLQTRGQHLQELGVAFQDLTSLFVHDPGTIYVDTCCHYNRRGIELFARAIAERLPALIGTSASD